MTSDEKIVLTSDEKIVLSSDEKIVSLPNEIINNVCNFLSIVDMTCLSNTCIRFHNFIQNDRYYLFCKETYNKYGSRLNGNRVTFLIAMGKKIEYFKRFYTNNPTIYHNTFFKHVCAGGHLELAKTLKEIFPAMDISEDFDAIFLFACEGNQLECAKWLMELCPRYKIRYGHDGSGIYAVIDGTEYFL